MTNNMQHLADILARAQAARGEPIPEEPPARVCSICQGAGYLRYDVSVDDPRFGQLVICECTREVMDQRRQRMLLERSQLDRVPDYTFARWEVKERGKTTPSSPDHAHNLARMYAADPGGNGLPWLFLYGPTGTGKTHLAAAVGHERIALGQPAMFAVVPELLRYLRKTFSADSDDSFDDLFEALLDTPLLILDDLGTQSATPWAAEQLFQLFNHRYNRRLPTVITMNVENVEVDPRLWSRINDKHLTVRCEIRGKDRRTDEPAPASTNERRTRVRRDYHL